MINIEFQEFIKYCPFKLGDKIKFILDTNKYSSDFYVIYDILAFYSIKNETFNFKIIPKDVFGNKLMPRNIDTVALIK